eukprot:CCRYP_002148-RA/>CCRYP_002148-RA protein AED:0.33 eAED:0.49 QI:0/0/0.33/1/0/0/3/239/60
MPLDFSIGQVQGANPMASTASPLPAINLAVSILVYIARGHVRQEHGDETFASPNLPVEDL